MILSFSPAFAADVLLGYVTWTPRYSHWVPWPGFTFTCQAWQHHTHTHTHTASAQPPVLECVEQAFCLAGTPAAGASCPAPLPSQTHKIKIDCIHSYCLFMQNSDPKVHHNIMPSVRLWLELWFLMVWCVWSDNEKPQKVTLIRKSF